MARRQPLGIAAAALVAACGLAACASGHGGTPGPEPAAPVLPIATSMVTPGATWAIVRTGGPGAGGRFWQLLVRPAGSSTWKLATPPGVADNGGLVVAGTGGDGMTAGFVPSQLLRFTPLASTADDGGHWSQGLLPAGLTAGADALAALPGGRLVAVSAKGALESGQGGAGWTTIATVRSLAATAAGRACGLVRLTAVTATPAGEPLLAGQCGRPGKVQLFERETGGWHAVGLALPGTLAKHQVSVLQIITASSSATVLLAIGTGHDVQVVPAKLTWRTGTLKAGGPLPGKGSRLTSTFAAAGGSWGVVFAGQRIEYAPPLSRPDTEDFVYSLSLTSLPAPDATLVFGSAAGLADTPATALVPGVDTVKVWERGKGGRWRRTQVIGIPSAPGS
jgi:hypothetical protein